MAKTSCFAAVSMSLMAADNWPVTEASKEGYFQDKAWKKEVVAAERFEVVRYKFTLKNGDFVVVERSQPSSSKE